MKEEQIIQEINLNLKYSIPYVGWKGISKVCDFLYNGCYEEVYAELFDNVSEKKK